MTESRGSDPPPQDRILVSGLRVETFIGVHEFERLERQAVVFDVEATTVPDYSDIVSISGEYVSYGDIVEFIESQAKTEIHIELVETWAENIAAFVLENKLVESVKVRVLKIGVFDAADAVGIEIVRTRPAVN